MVLYLIGLGLYDEQDITLRGLKAVQQCERVYLEAYTSILLCDKSKLEALYGKDVVVADRYTGCSSFGVEGTRAQASCTGVPPRHVLCRASDMHVGVQ
jgi:hypothetical protein